MEQTSSGFFWVRMNKVNNQLTLITHLNNILLETQMVSRQHITGAALRLPRAVFSARLTTNFMCRSSTRDLKVYTIQYNTYAFQNCMIGTMGHFKANYAFNDLADLKLVQVVAGIMETGL